jgi:thiamine-phosphate pyrophosphorylase
VPATPSGGGAGDAVPTPGRAALLDPTGRLGRLHVLVDSLWLAEAALEGGAPTVQVRAKSGTDRDRLRLAGAVVERCRAAGATCLVNDRADLAIAAGADGVHVGGDDLPVATVRAIVGPDAIVGGTARTPEAGRILAEEGASYLGVGPTYATTSKDGLPQPLGPPGVAAVAEAVAVPVIAIAGITAARVAEVLAAGAWGVAVISAVADASDPHTATHDLLMAVTRAVEALESTS